VLKRVPLLIVAGAAVTTVLVSTASPLQPKAGDTQSLRPGAGPAETVSGQLDGRVIDGITHQAIGDAAVHVEYRGNRSSSSQSVLPDGTFILPYDGETPVMVVSASGYSTYRASIRPGQRDATASLDRDIVVSGRLARRGEAVPLPGMISILSPNPRNIVSKTVRTTDGSFSIDDILPGRTYLMAKAPGMGALVKTIRLEAGATVDGLLFEFEPAATVSGQVKDAGGRAVEGISLEVEYALPIQERSLLARFVGGRKTTGSDGRFILSGITPGIQLRIVASGRPESAVVLGALAAGSKTEAVIVSVGGLAR
jgi:hypothetical protein